MKTAISRLLAVAMTLFAVGCQSQMVAELETCVDELRAEHSWAYDQLSYEGCNSLDRRTRSRLPSERELTLFEPAFEKASECNTLQQTGWQSQGIDAESISGYSREDDALSASFLKGQLTYGEYCSSIKANYATLERRASDQRYAEKADIMEESDQNSLACISAGGRPIYERRNDLIGDSELVYERCVANTTQVSAPVYQPTWEPLPNPNIDTFQKRDRGQRCRTDCSGSSCNTICSPR